MPNSSHESQVVPAVSWGGSIFGILSGLALFLPGAAQTFMMERPLIGWGCLALVLATYAPLAHWYLRRAEATQSRAWGKRVTALSAHWGREEKRLAAEFRVKESKLLVILTAKDDFLLLDRLKGMELDSDFHSYLTHGDGHENLNILFAAQLEDLTKKWHKDSREFSDAEVDGAWKKVRSTGEAYENGIDAYLFRKDEHPQRLHFSSEWKLRDRAGYYKAVEKLDALRSDFCVSLNELHRLQHARGITAVSIEARV